VRKDSRITAHFTICFLALVLFRYLERMIGHKYTSEQIIQGLRNMKFLKCADAGYVPAYTRNNFTDDLHDAFGFRTDFEIISKSKMRKTISTTKKS
ncbi:MAG: transposase, partial [Oscillospiraceae bacterium]|nr:transposase [Oscillospiraceae bacterium]